MTAELHQVLSMLSRRAIQVLLEGLREERRTRLEGKTRGARWFTETGDENEQLEGKGAPR